MLEEDLTRAEKVWLERYRRREATIQAATRWGVPLEVFHRWEATGEGAPDIDLGGLMPHDHYAILRHRANLRQKDIARAMGVRQSLICQAEHGLRSLHVLREYWGH